MGSNFRLEKLEVLRFAVAKYCDCVDVQTGRRICSQRVYNILLPMQ